MNHHPGSDDNQLRRLLDDAVRDVEPGSALDTIRSRTRVNTVKTRRSWLLGAGAAVLATAATITAVSVLGDAGASPQADPGFTNASLSPDSPVMTVVPAYYAGDTGHGLRLFREFVPAKQDPNAAASAAYAAIQLVPSDPDYRNLWDEVSPNEPDAVDVGSVEQQDDTIVVDLTSDEADLRLRPAQMSEQEATLAIEQVIYSVQGALQSRDPVQFLLEGQRTDMVLGVPTSEPLAQGDPDDVLAQVWIIDPAEDSTAPVPFTVNGLANAFEANVQWELMQGEKVIEQGFTMAKECCTMSPYSFTVKDVPPGDYTLVVHDEDASGGAEGAGAWTDTKDITVGGPP